MQIAEDYQAFNLGIGKDLGLFGAFSFDITQANTTLADGTRHSGQSVKSVYSKSSTRQEPISRSQDIAILRKVL
ncbi:fimbria/pilus outer membrane usher protein [Escherichia coli]